MLHAEKIENRHKIINKYIQWDPENLAHKDSGLELSLYFSQSIWAHVSIRLEIPCITVPKTRLQLEWFCQKMFLVPGGHSLESYLLAKMENKASDECTFTNVNWSTTWNLNLKTYLMDSWTHKTTRKQHYHYSQTGGT